MQLEALPQRRRLKSCLVFFILSSYSASVYVVQFFSFWVLPGLLLLPWVVYLSSAHFAMDEDARNEPKLNSFPLNLTKLLFEAAAQRCFSQFPSPAINIASILSTKHIQVFTNRAIEIV